MEYDINQIKYANDDKQRGTAMAPVMKLQELNNPVLQRAGYALMRELRPHLTGAQGRAASVVMVISGA